MDEEEYFSIKSKYSIEKESAAVKKKEFSKRLELTKKSVEQYLALAERLEKLVDATDYNEQLVRSLVGKIIVNKDKSIELVLNCRDVFDDELISEYLGETHDAGNSFLSETI